MYKSFFKLLSIFIFIPFCLNGAGHQVIIWEKGDQYIIEILDVHDFLDKQKIKDNLIDEFNEKHANEFMEVIQRFNRKDSLIIYEDIYNCVEICKAHKSCRDRLPEFVSLMSKIRKKCEEKKTFKECFVNVEFRHEIDFALNEEADDYDKWDFASKALENIRQWIIAIERFKNEDSTELSPFYDSIIQQYDSTSFIPANLDETLLLLRKYWDYYKGGEYPLSFDIIDAIILHQIVTAKDKKFIFVIAGGQHIERINILLEKMGYSKKFIHGTHLDMKLQNDEIDKLIEKVVSTIDLRKISKFFQNVKNEKFALQKYYASAAFVGLIAMIFQKMSF